MAYQLILRDVPAFAYSANPMVLSPCRLMMKYSEARSQASITLAFSAHVGGFEVEQAFVLRYDVDNLVAGSSYLRPTAEPLSQVQRSRIMRDNKPTLMTLYLTLHEPCRVRCPVSPGCFGPKLGHEASFDELRGLARALNIGVIFDHNNIQKEHFAAFHQLVNCPSSLFPIPAKHFRAPNSREADWTVFGPDKPVLEAPPSYTDVAGKRHWQDTSSLSSASPPRKRTCATPRPEAAPSANPSLGSPTEKATTTASPSPPRPSSPYHAPEVLDVVGNAVETIVPQLLRKILPGVLSDLFESEANADHNDPTSIRAQLLARMMADARPQLTKLVQEIEDDTTDHERDIRRYTEAQLEEDLDNHRVDMASTKEEALVELSQEVEKLTEEFIETTDAKVQQLNEDVQALIDDAFNDLYDRLKELVEQKKRSLQKYSRDILGQNTVPENGGEYWDLGAGVQPINMTASELRGILLKHGVSYPSSATKLQLMQLFTNKIKLGAKMTTSPHEAEAGLQRRAMSLPV